MHPGYYVVRMPERGRGSRLIVESRPFRVLEGKIPDADEYAKRNAQLWASGVQEEHPKDHVFVIKVD